ncbi:MAG: ribbon-helix-helix protein, CopG family [Acidobacteriota bacterium]|nr:ribbon-helix-helix protein, CopG family [Acidobacteriota bacterium]
MQETAEASPTLSAASFAALLASLAAPAAETVPEPASAADDALADDVATLSYEQALRAHARYRPADAGALPGLSPATRPGNPATRQNKQTVRPPESAKRHPAVPRENRKSASITIRLSEEEAAQLRERAAEAGMTVSAYLRSCAFEVEALRTQVKQALSEIRSAAPAEEPGSPAPGRAFSPQPTWRARLFPRWAGSQRPAHA